MNDRNYFSDSAVADEEEPPDSSEFWLDRQYYFSRGRGQDEHLMTEGRVFMGDGNRALRE